MYIKIDVTKGVVYDVYKDRCDKGGGLLMYIKIDVAKGVVY